jgi:signal transduction histidine kinase
MNSKRYIPLLITFALLALIALQGIWLILVYKHKTQELKDKTREAVLETTKRLQQEEDSKLIINHMDSLLLTENIIGSDSAAPIRVIVSNIRNKIKVDTLSGATVFEHDINANDDSSEATTILKIGKGSSKKIIVRSITGNNVERQTTNIENFSITADNHSKAMAGNEKKIEEHRKLLAEHEVKLKAREKKLAEHEEKGTMSKESLQREYEAIQKEYEAIQKENIAIQNAEQMKQLAHMDQQTASIQLQSAERNLELEKLAKDARRFAIVSETKARKLEKKAGELQKVFLKMAIGSNYSKEDLIKRIDFDHIQILLKDELIKRGIDLDPQIDIEHNLKGTPRNQFFIPFSTRKEKLSLPLAYRGDALPLYPDDVIDTHTFIRVGYFKTTAFILKQMTGLLSLSLFITILIGVIMIYLFRRMLSQEKLHNMKNDFINNMTHELKTPIATMSLAVDAINNPVVKNDEEKFRNYTGILKEENKKLNSHIERVLQMAMLDKGEMMLVKKYLDVKNILLNCVNSYRLQIQERNAKINLALQDNLIIEADEFHLTNAFTNLLDNSLKYARENPEISISASQNGQSVEIHFSDNGIGIDKNDQEKIFDKFYRVQGGNLHDVKGFGLGLSYVRSIIEAHGGTIELKSEKDKGSEFIIKLKAHEMEHKNLTLCY